MDHYPIWAMQESKSWSAEFLKCAFDKLGVDCPCSKFRVREHVFMEGSSRFYPANLKFLKASEHCGNCFFPSRTVYQQLTNHGVIIGWLCVSGIDV